MSRVRQFSIPCAADGGFGITLRGNSPVFVRSVDFPSPARTAGVKSGDLLLEVNWDNVRCVFRPSIVLSVEPPNKGHFGDNINSAVVSFVERLSSSRRFKNYREKKFWDRALCPL